MSGSHAEKLADWVKQGGILISEACPALFSDRLHLNTVQPGLGLAEVFGVEQAEIELMPDILDDIPFTINGNACHGSGYLQTYLLKGAIGCGNFEDGIIAATNTYGKGKTLLLGTFPSVRYFDHSDTSVLVFFERLLSDFGISKGISCAVREGDIHVRQHQNGDSNYLWVLNTGDVDGEVSISDEKPLRVGHIYWGAADACHEDKGVVTVKIPARDAVVMRIE
jgi:beta-galactosidase